MSIKFMRCLLLLFAVLSGINAAHADDAFNDGTADLPRTAKWMSWLNNDVRIRTISIPGTHDSGSRFGITGFSKNQSLTISQQLNAGIRFLDVRLRHIDNTFTIHHGVVFQNLMFADVMRDTAAFLKANPSEFVFMRVKEEHTPQNVTRSFEQTFESYRKRFEDVIWKPTKNNPSLAEVRGRIVFVQDFSNYELPSVGLWLRSFTVQDDWEFHMFNVDRKAPIIINAFKEALASKSSVINNIAVSAPPHVPKTTAYAFNNLVLKYLNIKVFPRPAGDRFVGILPMDYPGAGVIDAIIRTNNVSCSAIYLDAKTRHLVTCFGKTLASLTGSRLYSEKCDGNARLTRLGVACFVTNTNTPKPLRLEMKAACSSLVSSDGRFLSCDNARAATHTAPVIACDGYWRLSQGMCVDRVTKLVKPLDISCNGAPANLPRESVTLFGCPKPGSGNAAAR